MINNLMASTYGDSLMVHFIWLAVFIFTFLIYRILLALFISKDCRDKKLNSRIMWSLLAFIFGFIILPIYFIFTHKIPREKSRNSTTLKIILLIFSIVFLVVFFTSLNYYNERYLFSLIEDNVTYTNSYGEEVIYDRMGNEYTMDKANNILYYDSIGNSYVYTKDSGEYGYKCIETGKFYPSSFSDAINTDKDYFIYKYVLINESGYVSTKDGGEINFYSDGIYYDADGKLYYDTYLCSWDKDGNLVFPVGSLAEDLTYEKIMENKSK